MGVFKYNQHKKIKFCYNYIFFYKILFFHFFIFPVIAEYCQKEKPLLKGKSCVYFCEKEEINNKTCYINNTIIKTQWLTNVIGLGDEYFTYINFVNYSNGDMIIEVSSTPTRKKIFFYGLNNEGRPFFNDNQFNYSLVLDDQSENINNGRLIIDTFIANINNKEYLINIGKGDYYTKIYYLKQKEEIFKILSTSLFNNNYKIKNNPGFSNNYIYNNKEYILLGYWDTYTYFNLMILNLNSINITNNDILIINSYSSCVENSVSCFLTEHSKTIICLSNIINSGLITAFDQNLNEIGRDLILTINSNKDTFLKCIHLKDEIGVFIYYNRILLFNADYPTIIFKNFNGNSFVDYLNEIKLDKKSFNINFLLNDIIKISDKKLCFSSTSEEKDELYIVLINIFDSNNLAIRYYSIAIKNLYKYKILSEIKLHLYKNFISFGFNFCTQNTCSNEETDLHSSAFMIFSYSNGTDFNLNMIDYLLNNSIQIDNFIINLKKNIIIENNIFGLVYSGIKIKSINNCDNIYFVSSTKENTLININYTLDENENLKLKLSSNYYCNVKCELGYSYIITEPNFQTYNKYPIERVVYYTDKESSTFNNQKSKYEGKTIYYNIIIDRKLKKPCEDENCEFCLDNNNTISNCILYKNKYNISEDNEGISKPNNTKDNSEEYNTNEYNTEEYKSEYIKELFTKIKEDYLTANYNGENIIIEKGNIIFQLSTLESQKNNNNPNVSSIDLGECENILKSEYNIPNEQSLLIIKNDIKNQDTTYVQYEIYDPITRKQLDLNYCNDVKISIYVPVNLNEETISLYDALNKSGYNLFDSGDSFYNDICTPFTSSNGTDMILEDRKKEIYNSNGNISMCQNGCKFEFYNITSKKAKCNCEVQNVHIETDESKIVFSKKDLAENFLKTLTNSNFMVLKCYKLAFKFKNFFKNKGRIILTLIFISFIILLIIYSIKDRKQINFYINTIINLKLNLDKNNKQISKTEMIPKNKMKKKKKLKKKKKKKNKKYEEIINNKKNINNGNNKTNIESNENKINNENNNLINEGDNNNTNNKENNEINNNKEQENINNLDEIYVTLKNDNIQKESNIYKDNKDNNKSINNGNKNNENINNENINKENINNENINNESINNENINNENINNEKKDEIKLENFEPPPKKKKIYNIINNSRNEDFKNTNTIYSNQNAGLLSKSYQHLNIINNNISPLEKQNDDKKIDDIQIYKNYPIITDKEINQIEINKSNLPKFNDQELNNLSYENAIIYDKRTYWEYYWSLLKKKQLILFTFIPANDYNLISLKISLFLLSFSLYFIINAFFFSDETMHKIHEDNGKYNFLFQIPQILYSSIVSTIINILLKVLSLSEKNILILKQKDDVNEAIKISKDIEKNINIKFIIFFILSNLLLLFFWYFISCFCAVYINTQSILIKDTLVSFTISMIYPFGLNLLPGFLRMPSLKSFNKNKKVLYQISKLVALI